MIVVGATLVDVTVVDVTVAGVTVVVATVVVATVVDASDSAAGRDGAQAVIDSITDATTATALAIAVVRDMVIGGIRAVR